MAKAKTTETTKSVAAFVKTIEDKKRQADCNTIIEIMKTQSGFEPKMWGSAIIGFGSYHYVYQSGHQGDAPMVAFSPRKNRFSLYIGSFKEKEKLLAQFGKHTAAKACVYIKNVEDISIDILKKLVTGSVQHYRDNIK